MASRKPRSANSAPDCLSVHDVRTLGECWILDGEIRRHSSRTAEARRDLIKKLAWFMEARGLAECDTAAVRAFLAHVAVGHLEPGGRWGNAQNVRPVKPRTSTTYYGNLKTFFEFAICEEAIEASPMARIRRPIARDDQIIPFTDQQVQALLEAARRSPRARRDQALILVMLGTGARVSEVCGLRYRDLDMMGRRIVVRGKGDKLRSLELGNRAYAALWRYLRGRPKDPDEPLFTSEGGHTAGQALTRSGVYQIILDLGAAAGIAAVRCSPHTFRHTFARGWVINRESETGLMHALGHTSLTMTQKYVKLFSADVAGQHRRCCPADRMNLDPRKWVKERGR